MVKASPSLLSVLWRHRDSSVNGAIAQEIVNGLAVLSALRPAFPPRVIHDL